MIPKPNPSGPLPGDTINITTAHRIAGSLKSITTTRSYRIDRIQGSRFSISRVLDLVTLNPEHRHLVEYIPVLITSLHDGLPVCFIGRDEYPAADFEIIPNITERLRLSLAAKGVIVPHLCPECEAELQIGLMHICPARD
jgi:hypothetical protein